MPSPIEFPPDATPEEIRTFLADYGVELPADVTRAEIDEFLSGAAIGDPDSGAEKNSRGAGVDGSDYSEGPPLPVHPHAKVANWVGRNLPMVGGAALGLASGGASIPVGMMLAGLGGMGGRGFQIAADAVGEGTPLDPQGTASPSAASDVMDMGTHGAEQAAWEGGGRLAANALIRGGRRLMSGHVKTPEELAEKLGPYAVQDTLMEARAPLMSDKAERMMEEAVKEAQALKGGMVAAADATQPRVHATEVLPAMSRSRTALKQRAKIGETDQSGLVRTRAKNIIDQFEGAPAQVGTRPTWGPGPTPRASFAMGPNGQMVASHAAPARVQTGTRPVMRRPRTGVGVAELEDLKKMADARAEEFQSAVRSGTSKDASAEAMINDDVRKALKAIMEGRVDAAHAGTGAPRLADVNDTIRRLVGSTDALKHANWRARNNLAVGTLRDTASAGTGAAMGHMTGSPATGWASLAALRALASPGLASRIAIGMNETSKLPLATAPRGLMSLVRSHEDE